MFEVPGDAFTDRVGNLRERLSKNTDDIAPLDSTARRNRPEVAPSMEQFRRLGERYYPGARFAVERHPDGSCSDLNFHAGWQSIEIVKVDDNIFSKVTEAKAKFSSVGQRQDEDMPQGRSQDTADDASDARRSR